MLVNVVPEVEEKNQDKSIDRKYSSQKKN